MTRSFLSAAVLATALAACQNPTNDNVQNTSAGEANMASTNMPASTAAVDATFLTDAMKGDNSEVALGKLVAAKASSQDVKNLANMLASDHSAHKQEVASIAQQAGVPVTEDLKDDTKAEQDKLNGLSGAAFDQEFLRAAVDSHQKGIAKYEAQAKSGDPQTAALANKTLPTLKKHLQAAQALQK
jgi:putative membrane protein